VAYTKFHDPWDNAASATGGGDEDTPITAAALDHIETGIFDAAADADAAQAAADAAQATADAAASLALIIALG